MLGEDDEHFEAAPYALVALCLHCAGLCTGWAVCAPSPLERCLGGARHGVSFESHHAFVSRPRGTGRQELFDWAVGRRSSTDLGIERNDDENSSVLRYGGVSSGR